MNPLSLVILIVLVSLVTGLRRCSASIRRAALVLRSAACANDREPASISGFPWLIR